jgi:outer membrane protein assembly factor BamB
VIALDSGILRAFSTEGKRLWEYSARGRISPFVSRSREGTSYLSRTTGAFIAVNRSGRELWRRFPGGPLVGKAVSGWDGRLFTPTKRKLSCYTASGNLLWSHAFDADYSLPPQLDLEGSVIFALDNNEACRAGPFSDWEEWKLPQKPAALLSVMYRETARVMAIYQNGTVAMLGADGNIESAPAIKFPPNPIAAVSRGNEAAAVFANGRAALVSLDNGKTLWEADSHIREIIKNGGKADQDAEMLFDERGIYVLSAGGASGFTHDGRRLWYTLLKNAAAPPAFGDDGVLYSGGQDWILYAYKMEDRVLPGSASFYGPLPAGEYGTAILPPPYLFNFIVSENEAKAWLKLISIGVKNGKVGIYEMEWTTQLLWIASSRCPIQYRVEALSLLGRIGSQETIPWLARLFRVDKEPLVKAAAASAIGAIGVDPEGVAIRLFQEALLPTSDFRDEQVLFAITKATGSLCRFSGPPLSETGAAILTALSGFVQIPIVRRQAQKELDLLRK